MNKTKFKKRWIKSVRYCFSYFEHIYNLFSFQISKTYLCDTYKPKTNTYKRKLPKKPSINRTRFAFLARIIIYTHAQIVIMSNRYFVTSIALTGFRTIFLAFPSVKFF